MKIGVLSLAIGDIYKETVKYGIETHKNYCKKHGYDYINDESIVDYNRRLEWSKILLILKYLSKYDYVFWIDADTFIMNDSVKLEELVECEMKVKDATKEKELMYTTGHGWINNGMMFVKNTVFMHEYFTETYKHTNEICREMGAMDKLWRENWAGCRDVIEVVQNQKKFNSFWDNYSWGDFIIHFPGCNEPNRPENSLRRMMNMFCPIKMQEDSDDTFLSRVNWLKNFAEKELGAFRRKSHAYLPITEHKMPCNILQDIINLRNG